MVKTVDFILSGWKVIDLESAKMRWHNLLYLYLNFDKKQDCILYYFSLNGKNKKSIFQVTFWLWPFEKYTYQLRIEFLTQNY